MERDSSINKEYVTHGQIENIIDVRIKPLEETVSELDRKTETLQMSYENLNVTLIEVQVTNQSLNNTLGQLMKVLDEMQRSDAVQEYRIEKIENNSNTKKTNPETPTKGSKEDNTDIITTTITVVGALLTSILATFFGGR